MSHRMLKRAVYYRLIYAFSLVLCCAAATPAKTAAEESLPNLIKRVKSAVVLITTYNEQGKPLQQGSGFFVERDRIITAFHVLGESSRVQIKTFDGKTYPVLGIAAANEKRDLVLLSVDASACHGATLEIEESLPRDGEEIIVVSNPLGSSWKVSKGITENVWDFQNLGELISITAAIAPGSSGGPVVNLRGRVVGVATMHMKAAGDLNFAVPGELITALRHDSRFYSRKVSGLNLPGRLTVRQK